MFTKLFLRGACISTRQQPAAARLLVNSRAFSATPFPIDPNDPKDSASFFEMVELYYDRAAEMMTGNLEKGLPGPLEERQKRVRGILSMIKPCNRVMAFTFPIKRDSGEFEMIEAWRAQHSDHKVPSKGGNYQPVTVTDDGVSDEGIVNHFCPSVRPFVNRLTYDLAFLHVYGS